MNHGSVKSLAKNIFYADNEKDFRRYAETKKYPSYVISALWEGYKFLLKSSYLQPWVKDSFVRGEQLEDVARKYGHTPSKVRSDIYRRSKEFENFFPFDLYDLMLNNQVTTEHCEIFTSIIMQLWKQYKAPERDTHFFVVDPLPWAGEAAPQEISDEEFDSLKTLFARLSRPFNERLLQNTNKRLLQYGLFLLETENLSEEDQERAKTLRKFMALEV